MRSRTTVDTRSAPDPVADSSSRVDDAASPEGTSSTRTSGATATPESPTSPAARPTTRTAAEARTRTANDPAAQQLRAQLESRADEPRTAQNADGKDPALATGANGKDPTLATDDTGGFTRVDGDAFRTDAEGNELPPAVEDVDQGSLGDCWLMAANAAVAHRDPEYIQDRISENEDGSFDVRLGDETHRVQPTFPDAGYADATPNNRTDTMWPALVEKAYAQQEGNSYESLDGGNPGRALEALTGQPSTRTGISDTSDTDDLYNTIRAGVTGDHPMVASTRDEGVADPYHENHAYAVLDAFERDGQQYVRVYNPWGTNDGARGVDAMTHDVPIEDFRDNFSSVHVSGG